MKKETGILRIECQGCKYLELTTLSRGNVMKAAFKCAQYKRTRMSLSSYVFGFQCFRFEAENAAETERIDILKEIGDIRAKLTAISSAVASDDFAETLKVQHPGYLIEKIKYIKKDAEHIVGQITYRAKEAA